MEKSRISIILLKPLNNYNAGQEIFLEKEKAKKLVETGFAFFPEIEKNILPFNQLNSICQSLIEDERKKEIPLTCANFILKNSHIITFSDTREIYFYNEGVYSESETFILNFLQKEIPDLITKHVTEEILNHIRRTTFINRDKAIGNHKNFICLENGILNLEKNEVLPHNPKIVFLQKLPVKFNENAICPAIEKFLKEILNENDISIIEELAGFCLLRDYSFQNAFVFVGTGRNGKSVLLNLFRAFLGKENVSARSLHDLLSNRFAKSDLFGKLANIFADLPTRDLNDTSNFKMLTGGDLIEAEKKFKNSFRFENYAKMLFSANQLSKTPEDTDAFFRRWIIINFPNEFNEKQSDKNLIKKLTTEKELSGFFNKAIFGLKRLQERGFFSDKSIEEKRENYIRLSDSVSSFIMDLVRVNPEGVVVKKEIYEAYTNYCREKNYPIETEGKFHKGLLDKINISDYRPRINGQRVQCWRGISVESVRDVSDVKVDSNLNKKKTGGLGDFTND